MASGGEPFSDPLYLAPGGNWLDAAAYQQAVGTPPPQGSFTPPYYPTLSPWYTQFTTSSGLRIPIVNGRGISSEAGGRTRVIGDLLSPAATIYSFYMQAPPFPGAPSSQQFIVWLPWPQLADPFRAQLVAALHATSSGVHLQNAGPDQIAWLPGETITGQANAFNVSASPVQATLQSSISGSSGVVVQPAVPLSIPAGQGSAIPLNIATLPNGDYTLTFQLMVGDQEMDRIDSPVRVLDPTASRQPDQKISVANGAFYAHGRRVFLHGANYSPRYAGGLPLTISWLEPVYYDPDQVEADLSLIASLNFNLVNIQYPDPQPNPQQQARSLIDFLERCRNHGIWVRVSLPATLGNNAYAGALNPALGSFLDAAYLPGNDRVFAYEVLWEPFIGFQNQGGYGGYLNGTYVTNVGRAILDPYWRTWVNDQYGSLSNAQQLWGLTAPLDASGQLTNPTDDQISSDGPWRTMVAAYRRFTDDYLGRNLGVIAREIRRTDPDTLLSYRNWATMIDIGNSQTTYDLGTAAAHLDFFSPENYDSSGWPDHRKWGLVTAYSRYRTGGKPVQWAEFGYNIGLHYGTLTSRAAQTSLCDTFMRQVNDDGSNADSIWNYPGGLALGSNTDFGIIDPDGTPRDCALALAQWGATFASAPPDLGSGSPVTLTVDRDADARGEYGLFLNWQNSYVQARQAGQPVILADQGTGSDTSTMPLIQVGNEPYAGSGPLKFANAEIGGVQIVCPSLDVTVENGSQVQIPSGVTCHITPTLVNTGQAQWLPAAASKGGVLLHTSQGDVPLTSAVPSLERIAIGAFPVSMGQSTINLTGRMSAQGSGDFGEVLRLTLGVDSIASGPCAISLNPTSAISAPASGASAAVNITAASGCAWTASSPQPWVTIAPVSGTGSGQVIYRIAANTGPVRQTTVAIAGHPFAVSQAAAANPALVQAPALSRSSLNFGSQTIGGTAVLETVTLTNTGTAAFNVSAVVIGGLNDADFAQTNTCGSTLAVTASCTISVNFVPLGAGTRVASLFVMGNAAGGPLTIKLTGSGMGTGPPPNIQAVVDAWNYTPGIAPGLWVTIGGMNFAAFAETANFGAFQQLPTNLGGVSVTFNSVPAALYYADTKQVNALVPASIVPGPVQVVVQVNGVNSNPFPITAKPTQPAIYALPNADGSTFFVTAALQGTGFLVGNSAVDSRVVRPVFPSDVLDLYMIGLGATAVGSNFITNQVFTGGFPVSAQVTATVGGEPAPVLFAGLTSPGLYLVRISIPADLKPGPQPIQVSTGSSASGGAETRPLTLTMGTPGANLIQNGNFGSALAGAWSFTVNTSQGAAASVQTTTSTSVDAQSSAQVTVSSAATDSANFEAVQLSQAGLSLQQGQVYRLLFWAKADAARTLHFDLKGSFDSAVAIGTNWQQYVIYFQATATVAAAQLDFYFGDQTGNTWLDAVILQGPSP